MIDPRLFGSTGGAAREQKLLQGHLPRATYHQEYWHLKMNPARNNRVEWTPEEYGMDITAMAIVTHGYA